MATQRGQAVTWAEFMKCCRKLQKVAKSFGGSKKSSYLRGMNHEKYVITGINTLSGEREEISRPMSREDAEARLQRENESRRRQRYAAHKRLRVERRLPVQLTINFNQE